MRNGVEKLRVWLLGSAVFLVLVIVAFIGSARYLRRHYLSSLPAKLGIDIKGGANGYTLSRTVGSRTIFTLHAKRWEQHKDGMIALHDVSIVLYGQKGNRHDLIYGDEFEYNQSTELVRATGLVHIDLKAAGTDESGADAKAGLAPPAEDAASEDGPAGPKVMRVTTSGLVYMEKLGVAATSEDIEFQTAGITGHAKGADYSSDSGTLMLHSAVSMSGKSGKRQVALTAATAEIDNRNRQTFLTHATYASQGKTAEADQATLYTRPDGTLERVQARGNVTGNIAAAKLVSQQADVMLNAQGQPKSAVLTGGVAYSSELPLRQAKGQAEAATIAFDAKGQPEHAVFTGAVRMTERMRATQAAKEPWSVRDLAAAKVEAALAPMAPGRTQLRDAEATGSPRLTLVDNGSLANASHQGTTELSADDLKAHLIEGTDAKQPPQLDTIAGRGHTLMHQVRADGLEQTITGDTLDAKMRPKAVGSRATAVTAAGGSAAAKGGSFAQVADTLLSAVQQGHVTIVQRMPTRSGTNASERGDAKAGGAAGVRYNAGDDVQHATAERAAYDGDLDRMTLTGPVQLTDAGSVLWAKQVVLDHKTGDAHAEGAVKVDYVQADSSLASGQTSAAHSTQSAAPEEPTHILADRADMEHATDIATFYGKPVRLWQGGSQVQAPVIELNRAQKRLIARGDGPAASPGASGAQSALTQVHTVLASTGGGGASTLGAPTSKPSGANKTAEASKPGAPPPETPDVMKVASNMLSYSGPLRRADFNGGVRAETVDGTIHASQATVWLQQPEVGNGAAAPKEAAPPDNPAVPPSLSGKVQRMLATGHVEIIQPGLLATGETLVYTAIDQYFVLTGDDRTAPKAVTAQSSMTGAALRFHRGGRRADGSPDATIEALGSFQGGPVEPVRTDSRVSNKRKTEGDRR